MYLAMNWFIFQWTEMWLQVDIYRTITLGFSENFINFDQIWPKIDSKRGPKIKFWSEYPIGIKLMSLQRISNSLLNDCSWVEIRAKTIIYLKNWAGRVSSLHKAITFYLTVDFQKVKWFGN